MTHHRTDNPVTTTNSQELSTLVKQLSRCRNRHVLPKDVPVSCQDFVSLYPKHTVCQLHNVINIMQRMSQTPFHINLQAIVADSNNPEKFWTKKFYTGFKYYFFVWQKDALACINPVKKAISYR
jgi:hypothetical protein